MTQLKKSIDFKYDSLRFKERAEFRRHCEGFVSAFKLAKNGTLPERIVLPRQVYMEARANIKKVKYAEDDAKFYFDSIPVYGYLVDS